MATLSQHSKDDKEEICQHWTRGHCMYGDSCRYAHPKELFATKKSRNDNTNDGKLIRLKRKLGMNLA